MVSTYAVLRSWRPGDYVAAASATITLLRIEHGLRREPLPTVAARLGVPMTAGSGAPDGPAFAGHLTPGERRALRGVTRVLRHWFAGDTCLRRSLAVGHTLRRHRPTLRVGVAKKNGKVTAHAWLEINGTSLDPEAGAYMTLDVGQGEVP